MSGEAGTPQKVCVVCKQDCSTRKRSRDDLGRYTCQDCLDKAAGKSGKAQVVVKSASAAVPAGAKPPVKSDAASLGALGAEPLPSYLFEETPVNLAENEKFCNSCGKVMKKNAVLCTTCGKNQETGKSVHTVLKKAEVIKERKRGGGFTLDHWIPVVIMGVMAVGAVGAVLTLSEDTADETKGLILIAAMSVGGLLSLAALIGTFMESVLMGILMLVGGLAKGVPVAGFYGSIGLQCYMIYWMLVECDSVFTKTAYFSSLAVWVTIIFMLIRLA